MVMKERILYMSHLMLKEVDHVRGSDKYTAEQKSEMEEYVNYLREIEKNDYQFIYPPEFFKISQTFDVAMRSYDLFCDIDCGKIKLIKVK